MMFGYLWYSIRTKLPIFLIGNIFGVSVAFANDLSSVQQQIRQQEQKIAQQQREQSKLQSQLKAQESQINDVIGSLRQTETSLQQIQKSIADTNAQIKKLEAQEQAQKQKLAKQVEAIHRLGSNPTLLEHTLKDNAAEQERLRTYYQHLNRSRLALIEDLKQTRAQLDQDRSYIITQQKAQQAQLNEQKKQRQTLQRAQNERQATLTKINQTLSAEQRRLAQLRANETALRQKIQQAEQAAREREKREAAQRQQAQRQSDKTTASKQTTPSTPKGSGLGAAKKQYAYPVAGRILHQFGSKQAGELRWKGIVIGASLGTPVKAIADGRVIMTSWLQGYGLMVIIKHGENDLSLYGYTQAVSVEEGQYVKAGQKIAEVGNSGGQERSALYFEIRRKGATVNPVGWLR